MTPPQERTVRGAVATRDNREAAAGKSLATFIATMQPEIARALPNGMDADRMARLLLTAIRRDPKLAQCDHMSFAGAILTASALGLEPNTPNGEAYLVPYGQECTLIVGYQGLVKLFWQHPLAQHIDAQAVYEGDDFDYAYGLDPFLRHKPSLDSDRLDRPVTHYYAVAALKTGARAFVVLSPEQVKELRQGKVGPDKRFKAGDPMKWMERKTALRQLLKTLPRSTNLNHALASDEVAGSTLRRRELAGGTDPQPPDDEPVEFAAERVQAPAAPPAGDTIRGEGAWVNLDTGDEVPPPGVDPDTGEVDPTMDPSWGQDVPTEDPPPAADETGWRV